VAHSLFDPESVEAIADALERITAETRLRDELRAEGLRRAEGFTWSATAERHLSAYARVAAG